jgi:hypothetical protein
MFLTLDDYHPVATWTSLVRTVAFLLPESIVTSSFINLRAFGSKI